MSRKSLGLFPCGILLRLLTRSIREARQKLLRSDPHDGDIEAQAIIQLGFLRDVIDALDPSTQLLRLLDYSLASGGLALRGRVNLLEGCVGFVARRRRKVVVRRGETSDGGDLNAARVGEVIDVTTSRIHFYHR